MTASSAASLVIRENLAPAERFKCLLCSGSLQAEASSVFDTRFGIPGTYQIGICASCHLEQLVPRPEPHQLKLLYEQYYNFGGQTDTLYARAREWFFSSTLYRLWLRLDGDISFHNVRGSGRLLDVGCNEGRGLRIYERNGFEVEGLELNERSAQVARAKGFTVHTGLLESFTPDTPYDVVVLSNVLEHSLDPRTMLIDIARVLRPGGQVWISCPNATSSLRSIFGVYWINWHVPFHIAFFSGTSLCTLLKQTGFEKPAIRQITPALWVSSSIIARAFARYRTTTAQLRSPWLVPSLVLLCKTLLFPILFLANRFDRGDCLVATATRSM
jgi:SAM-dependent methyltransferase